MTLSIFAIYFFALAFFMVRLEVISNARLPIIRRIGLGRLPTLEAALFNPRYYLLWTEAQWVAWVEAQP